MPCRHAKLRSLAIFLPPDQAGGCHRLVLSIGCQECGVQFRFAAGDGAICFSDDRRELSAWIVEEEGPETGE